MGRKIFNILFLPIFLFGGNNPIQEIELEGIITNPKQEISGMTGIMIIFFCFQKI